MEQGGPLFTGDDAGDALNGLNGLGAVRSGDRDYAASHTQLTKAHWLRSVLAEALRSIQFRHEWDRKEGLRLRVVDSEGNPSSVPIDVVPWSHLRMPLKTAEIWGLDNKKMQCPVFDLPTGSADVYGTCPGAREGQSISASRPTLTGTGPNQPLLPGTEPNMPVHLPGTICQSCYAEAGPMAYTDNQLRSLMRYVWASAMTSRYYDDFVRLMAESLLALPESEFGGGTAPDGILPVRLHGGGDFFNFSYARAWIDIANVLAEHEKGHRIRIWAPTRTWAAAGWTDFWQRELPNLKMLNLIVRPSAFHFSDPAPGAFLEGSGEGSTSMYIDRAQVPAEMKRVNFAAQGREKLFFDWRCPVYSARGDAENAGCSDVINPNGSRHCRACWIRPDLRIDYPAH